MGWNLPPGCKTSDIPGNRPIDIAFDRWFEAHIDAIWEDYEGKQYDDPVEEYDHNEDFKELVDDRFQEDYYRKPEKEGLDE